MEVNPLDENAQRVLDEHPFAIRERRVNAKTRHFWVECPCGYQSSPGRSRRFAMSGAYGHLKRVALMLERGEVPADIRVSRDGSQTPVVDHSRGIGTPPSPGRSAAG